MQARNFQFLLEPILCLYDMHHWAPRLQLKTQSTQCPLHVLPWKTPGPNFIELLSTKICLAWNFHLLHIACYWYSAVFAYPDSHVENWLVILFLSRQKCHAKQIFVLSSSMKLGPVVPLNTGKNMLREKILDWPLLLPIVQDSLLDIWYIKKIYKKNHNPQAKLDTFLQTYYLLDTFLQTFNLKELLVLARREIGLLCPSSLPTWFYPTQPDSS